MRLILISNGGTFPLLINDLLKNNTSIDCELIEISPRVGKSNLDWYDNAMALIDAIKSPDEIDLIINAFGAKDGPNMSIDDEISSIKIHGIFPRTLLTRFKNSKILQLNSTHIYDDRSDLEFPTESSIPRLGGFISKSQSLYAIDRSRVINMHVEYLKITNEESNSNSLLPWVLSLSDNSNINGFIDHWWNGITDVALSKILVSLIVNDIKLHHGSYNITSRYPVSRYQLLNYISWEYNKNLNVSRLPSLGKKSECVFTSHVSELEALWLSAGYKEIPSIQYLIHEQREAANRLELLA